MKKKFLIGILGLISVFTLSSFEREEGTDGTDSTDRRFWGTTVESNGACSPTGVIQADGTAQCSCPVLVTYYVFWIGVSTSEDVRYTSC